MFGWEELTSEWVSGKFTIEVGLERVDGPGIL
jgi:hypothetical protein